MTVNVHAEVPTPDKIARTLAWVAACAHQGVELREPTEAELAAFEQLHTVDQAMFHAIGGFVNLALVGAFEAGVESGRIAAAMDTGGSVN